MDLYEAVETICKDYCKYPNIESGNRLADICDKCPMNKCEELRWADHKDEPTTQMKTQNSNLTFEKDECAKEYDELGLKELKELINADRKTENSSEIPNNCKPKTMYYPQVDGITPSVIEPKTEPQMGDAKPIPLSNRVTHIKDEPQTEEWYTYQDEQEYNARHGKE